MCILWTHTNREWILIQLCIQEIVINMPKVEKTESRNRLGWVSCIRSISTYLSWNISMKVCSIFTPLGKIQESFYTIWLPDYLHTYLHTYFFYLPSSFAVARESLIRKKLFRSKTIFIENLWIYLLLYKLQLQIFKIMTWV